MALKFFPENDKLKVGIISQARMTSTRLPGKVLMKAGNKTLLDHHFGRLAWSEYPVYMATTINQTDDILVSESEKRGIVVFRGDEQNVLSRFYNLANQEKLDVVVRVTSDCPLIDGHLIHKAVQDYLNWHNENIYYSNCLKRTYPRGFDFEVFSFAALNEAFHKATMAAEKEHVTPYINQNKSGHIEVKHFTNSVDCSKFRFTVDEPDDFRLMQMMIEQDQMSEMPYEKIKNIILANPEKYLSNAHVEQKKV